ESECADWRSALGVEAGEPLEPEGLGEIKPAFIESDSVPHTAPYSEEVEPPAKAAFAEQAAYTESLEPGIENREPKIESHTADPENHNPKSKNENSGGEAAE